MATKMTDKLFRAVKIMIAGGATSTEISEYFNVSLSSISRVRQAESFEEYKVMQADAYCNKEAGENPGASETAVANESSCTAAPACSAEFRPAAEPARAAASGGGASPDGNHPGNPLHDAGNEEDQRIAGTNQPEDGHHRGSAELIHMSGKGVNSL